MALRGVGTRLLIGACLVGCGPDEGPDRTKAPDDCAGSLPEGDVVVLADGFDKSEGLAFSPDGRLFITAGDIIAEIQPDGSWEKILDWPRGVGLAWWGDRLIAAGSEDGLDRVGSIDVDAGTAEILTTDIPKANFIAVTPWNSILVSDAGVAIWEVGPDGTTVPWLDLDGPNGMAFTPQGDALWVVNTWGEPGPGDSSPAWKVTLAGTTAGTVEEVHRWDAGAFPDGVALGESGALYTSLNVHGRISRLSAAGAEQTVADGAEFTASIAFGNHDRWDRCSVYSTSLFGSKLYQVGVGEQGLAVPY